MNGDDMVANVVIYGAVVLFFYLMGVAANNRERNTRVTVSIIWWVYYAVAFLILYEYADRVGGAGKWMIVAGLVVAGIGAVVWDVIVLGKSLSGTVTRQAPATPGSTYVPPRPFKPTWGRPRFTTASRTRYEGYRRANGQGG